jgi:hypothetical protein
MVTCFLRLIVDEDLETDDAVVEAEFDWKVGAGVPRKRISATFSKNQRSWGCRVDREYLLNKENKMILPNGALIIDVQLQVQVEKRAVWYPPTPIPNSGGMLVDLLETGSCSDVTFHVGQQDFCLHRFIL